eukprot:5740028-Lingulodinium_polyedra.AAC.1
MSITVPQRVLFVLGLALACVVCVFRCVASRRMPSARPRWPSANTVVFFGVRYFFVCRIFNEQVCVLIVAFVVAQ